MTKKSHFSRHRLFSDELLETITQTLENGGQALIFHNRRGSASTTLCESCGWSAMCTRCFVPYTLHADSHQLRCHICNSAERVPTSCPICQSTDIIHKGIGTKLIEAELQSYFRTKKLLDLMAIHKTLIRSKNNTRPCITARLKSSLARR